MNSRRLVSIKSVRRAAFAVTFALLSFGCSNNETTESSFTTTASIETSSTSPSTAYTCSDGNPYVCLVTKAREELTSNGLLAADNLLAEWATTHTRDAVTWCHGVAHDIGSQFTADGGEPEKIFEVPYSCGGGLLHGGFSSWTAKGGDMERLLAICGRVLNKEPVLLWDCEHGVGHAAGANAVGASDAFLWCDANLPRDACYSGAASAIAGRMIDGEDHHVEAGLLTADPRWCSGLSQGAARACWERTGILSQKSPTFSCKDASLWGADCAYGVGRAQGISLGAGLTWSPEWVDETRAACAKLTLASDCARGVAYETVLHGYASGMPSVCPLMSDWVTECRKEELIRRAFETPVAVTWELANDETL